MEVQIRIDSAEVESGCGLLACEVVSEASARVETRGLKRRVQATLLLRQKQRRKESSRSSHHFDLTYELLPVPRMHAPRQDTLAGAAYAAPVSSAHAMPASGWRHSCIQVVPLFGYEATKTVRASVATFAQARSVRGNVIGSSGGDALSACGMGAQRALTM
eukprot:1319924-Pleurochrysis_carterae.AAC.1